MQFFLFPGLRVVLSTLLGCMLVNKKFQAGLSLLRSPTALDLKPVVSLSQERMPREALEIVSTAAGTVWQYWAWAGLSCPAEAGPSPLCTTGSDG